MLEAQQKTAITFAFNAAMEDAAIMAIFTLLKYGDIPNDVDILAFVDDDVLVKRFEGFSRLTVRKAKTTFTAQPLTAYHDADFMRGCSLSANSLDALYAEGYTRVLWLDVDIFIRKSIRKLLEVDLGEYCFGACKDFHGDMGTLAEHDGDWPYKLSSNFKGYYFNAGIMVFNLQDFYQQYQLKTGGLTRILYENGKTYRFMDQCLFNSLIEEFYTLPQKYNWFPDWYTVQRDNPTESHRNHVLNDDVAIVHFVGPWKPWKGPIPESPVKYQLRIKEYFRLTRPIHGILSRWWWHNVRENLPKP